MYEAFKTCPKPGRGANKGLANLKNGQKQVKNIISHYKLVHRLASNRQSQFNKANNKEQIMQIHSYIENYEGEPALFDTKHTYKKKPQ